MDSHQRRAIRREMRRLGLEPIVVPEGLEPEMEPSRKPSFKWQDALGVVGIGLAIGGMAEMPIILRIACFVACAICLPISFSSHKTWPLFVRWLASLSAIVFMVFLIWILLNAAAKKVILSWDNPSPIDAGSPLTEKQLNANALSADGKTVDGDFTYDPAKGATLPSGTQTLHVSFTPADSSRFGGTKEKTVVVLVKSVPSSELPKPRTPIIPKSAEVDIFFGEGESSEGQDVAFINNEQMRAILDDDKIITRTQSMLQPIAISQKYWKFPISVRNISDVPINNVVIKVACNKGFGPVLPYGVHWLTNGEQQYDIGNLLPYRKTGTDAHIYVEVPTSGVSAYQPELVLVTVDGSSLPTPRSKAIHLVFEPMPIPSQ